MHDVIKFRAVRCGIKKKFAYGIGFLKSPLAYDFLVTDDKNEKFITVKQHSLAQFIAYDANRKEIYEGDKIVDKYGNELTACLSIQGVTDDGQRVDLEHETFEFILKDVKLKEGV